MSGIRTKAVSLLLPGDRFRRSGGDSVHDVLRVQTIRSSDPRTFVITTEAQSASTLTSLADEHTVHICHRTLGPFDPHDLVEVVS